MQSLRDRGAACEENVKKRRAAEEEGAVGATLAILGASLAPRLPLFAPSAGGPIEESGF